jgi:hypothetical protein
MSRRADKGYCERVSATGAGLLLAGTALVVSSASVALAQDSRSTPCATSVVLKNCPDRQPDPFQTEAERSQAAERQQMQDQFANAEQQRQQRAAQAESDLDTVIVYGHQLAPAKPALAEFGQTVAKSVIKDCRTAYSTAGPKGEFGVFGLIDDAFTGKTCSWK